MALSDELERRVGQRTEKGTKITESHVQRARNIESEILEIREDNAKVIAEAVRQGAIRGLEAVGITVASIASDNAPVDTGLLAASITHALDNEEPAVHIGTSIEYALAQELGTSRIPAANGGKGYLRPAVQDNRQLIQEEFTAVFKMFG